MEYAVRCVFGTPSPAELVPSPYKQGESAIRMVVVHCTLSVVLS